MDKIKELIKQLHAEGKSVAQIAGEVSRLEEAKEFSDDAKKLAETIKSEIKAIELSSEIEKSEKADAEKSKLKAEVESTVKEVLKSMPAVKEAPEREVKYFDHGSKKMVSSRGVSEEIKAFGEMLGCLSAKNFTRAKDISKEIGQQKAIDMKFLGLDAKTALYSDATTGNYLIPTEVEAEIFQRAHQSVMLQLLNTDTITYNGKVYPVISEFDLAFIADENTDIGDKTPTIDNPSADLKRVGGITYSSNTLANLTGGQLVRAFVAGFGDSIARFTDIFTVAGSVTGNSDGFNGLVFDANTDDDAAAVAIGAVSPADLLDLKNRLGPKFRAGAKFLANSQVRDAYGISEDTSGKPMFKNFAENGLLRPYGKDFIENPYIPSTFDIATGKRTDGTDDVLIAVNGDGVILGFDGLTIASSEHVQFVKDQTAWRGTTRIGMKVLSKAASQGSCVAYKKITA